MLTIVLSGTLALAISQSTTDARSTTVGLCETEMARRGVVTVRVGAGVPMPKKIRHVNFKWPEWPRGGVIGRGPWIGEFLIGTSGHVARVWTTREVRLTPAFPAFNQAIVDAIKQWRFEPFKLDGRTTPVCSTVTVTIDWS